MKCRPDDVIGRASGGKYEVTIQRLIKVIQRTLLEKGTYVIILVVVT